MKICTCREFKNVTQRPSESHAIKSWCNSNKGKLNNWWSKKAERFYLQLADLKLEWICMFYHGHYSFRKQINSQQANQLVFFFVKKLNIRKKVRIFFLLPKVKTVQWQKSFLKVANQPRKSSGVHFVSTSQIQKNVITAKTYYILLFNTSFI